MVGLILAIVEVILVKFSQILIIARIRRLRLLQKRPLEDQRELFYQINYYTHNYPSRDIASHKKLVVCLLERL